MRIIKSPGLALRVALAAVLAFAPFASNATVASRPQSLFQSQTNCPQAGAFLQRLGSSQPSPAMRLRYQKLICALVNQKIWYKLDALYILAAEMQTAALANLVSKNYTLTVNGTMTFGPNAGFMGDGSTGFLATGFTPSTAGGHYAAGSKTLGVGISDPRQANASTTAIGAFNTSFQADYIAIGNTGNFGDLSNTSCGSSSPATANGAWVWTYSNPNIVCYFNGAQLSTASTASTITMDEPLIIGGLFCNGCSGSNVVNQTGDSLTWAFFGSALTASDVTNITADLSVFPTNPAGVAAAHWGFSNNKFSYNFALTGLDGIDYTGTKAEGFQFYNSFWFGCAAACGGDSAPSAAFSFSGGLVTVGNTTSGPRLATRGDTSSGFVGTVATNVLTVSSVLYGPLAAGQVLAGNATVAGLSITSCNTQTPPFTCQLSGSATLATPTNLTGNSSVGVPTFPAGGYYESTFSNTPANDTGSNGFPSFWMMDIAGLYNANLNSGYGSAGEWLEIDMWEGVSGARAADMNAFDWTGTNGGGLGTSNAVRQNFASVTNPNALHSYGLLWVPSTKNGGTGIIQFFLDRIPITSTITYSSGAGASPVCSPSNPNGCLLIGESGNFVLMFDSGGGGGNAYPINLQSVNVWQ